MNVIQDRIFSKTTLSGTFTNSDYEVCLTIVIPICTVCTYMDVYRLGPLTTSWCMRMEAKKQLL